MGGHFQPLRIDSVANDGDSQCPKGAVKFKVLLRTAMDAYVMVLFQRVIDTA